MDLLTAEFHVIDLTLVARAAIDGTIPMNRIHISLGLALAIFTAFSLKPARGQEFYSAPFYYTVNGSAATITGTSTGSGSLTIPATLGGLSVKTIADRAFYGRSYTSISLPASLTSANGAVFEGCWQLQAISVNSSNPSYSSVGGVLFDKTRKTIVKRPAGLTGNYTIPSSVTEIGNYAFEGNSITSIVVPSRITWVGTGAFLKCISLSEISLPSQLQQLGYYCFEGCQSLQTIVLPAKLKEVPYHCFYNCDALTRIEIPPLVDTIGVDAFVNCEVLEEVVIPKATTIIPPNSFWDSPSLMSFIVHPDNPTNKSIGGVLFDKAGTILKLYPAARKGSYAIPETVITIQNLGFKNAQYLTAVQLPNSLQTIPIHAFQSCGELRWVNIPASVQSVKLSAFYGCAKMERAVFAGDAPTLGTNVFKNTAANFTVYFHDGAAGFTTPVWEGYPAINMGAKSDVKEWLVARGLPYDADMTQEIGGVSLLVSYALDLELGEPMSPVEMVGETMKMTFFAGRSDVTYRVEASTDLSAWSEAGVTVTPVSGGPMQEATVAVSGTRFLRIAVER